MNIFDQDFCQQATYALSKADERLGKVIEAVGPVTLRRRGSRFEMLVSSIISQQISTSAARSIRKRVFEQFPGSATPEKIVRLSDETLRSCGLSPQKLRYMRDLSSMVHDGHVRLRTIQRLDDEAVIEHLTQIKGIGRWTAQMFLMFSLGRPDVFPVDDLGIRNAIHKIYRLKKHPEKPRCQKIAKAWQPYSTVACWYCWQSLELADL